MTELELNSILEALNAAIATYQKYEGQLTAREISVKSMLMAVRLQVEGQLIRDRAGLKT